MARFTRTSAILLLCVVINFLFIVLFLYLDAVPGVPYSLLKKTLQNAKSAYQGSTLDSDPDLESATAIVIPAECEDPYRMPGYLVLPENVTDPATLKETVYVPFYDTFTDRPPVAIATYPQPPHQNFDFAPTKTPDAELMRQAPTDWMVRIQKHVYNQNNPLVYFDENDEDAIADVAARNRTARELVWLRNKRVLMLADSVDRYMLMHFCTQAGVQGIEGLIGKHTLAICHIPSLNFTITHWHIPGMLSATPDWWYISEISHVPFEARFEDMYKQYLNLTIGMDGKGPDLIIYQSILWDTFNFARGPAAHALTGLSSTNEPPDEGRLLFWSELEFYRSRQQIMINYFRSLFSNSAPFLYRSALNHRFEGPIDIPVYQLDRVARAVAHANSIEVLEWAQFARGFYEIYRDVIHVNLSAQSWLYSNMMLYYLFRATGGEEVRGRVTKWPLTDVDKQVRHWSKGDTWEKCNQYNRVLYR
ncbi:hypothetical protein BZA70DRAFT_107274 [Myxozyma melibiosi]|uniref:Uncharacterized protein n=1 Tax=Myxozyma melibiosi TaxID=54550 RepID=A0ABR1F9M9_9ASCO